MRRRNLHRTEVLAVLEPHPQDYWKIQVAIFEYVEKNKLKVSGELVWGTLWELTTQGLLSHRYNPHRFMLTEKGVEEKKKSQTPKPVSAGKQLPASITRFCNDPHAPI